MQLGNGSPFRAAIPKVRVRVGFRVRTAILNGFATPYRIDGLQNGGPELQLSVSTETYYTAVMYNRHLSLTYHC